MSDNLIALLKIAADMPLSRIQDDEECADSLTRLCGRAAEALASLQQRNLLFMREREGAREDANTYQRLAAELSDKLNGTPCAEIRWMQERDELCELLREAYDDVALISENHELAARIDAALGGGDE